MKMRSDRAWWRRIGPWVGIGTSPVAMMAGGGLAESDDGTGLVVGAVIGVAVLSTLAAGQGLIGQRQSSRFAAVAGRSLGRAGARYIAAPVVALMMIGWFGFNTSLAGAGLGKLLDISAKTGVLVFAAMMLIVAWRGLDTLSLTALIAGCATVALAASGLRSALDEQTGPLLTDGTPGSATALLAAVGIVVGYGAAFSLRTPDFTHDLARRRDVRLCATFGLALPLLAFLIVGAILQTTTGTWNLVHTLERIGSPTIAYAFVALGFTGSVLSNLHSGAVAFEEITPSLDHRHGLIITAIAGTSLALTDFTDQMIPFLTLMAVTAPCLIAVTLIDTWRHQRARRPIRTHAVMAWLAGAVTGLVVAGFSRPAAFVSGLAVSAAVALFRAPAKSSG